MDPLRSRCLCVRVPGPSNAQIQEQMALVARKEGFTLPPAVSSRAALASHRNLRRALLMLEVAYVQSGGQLAEDTKVLPPDWELYIMVGAGDIRNVVLCTVPSLDNRAEFAYSMAGLVGRRTGCLSSGLVLPASIM